MTPRDMMLAMCALLLAACSSTKPTPVSPLRQQAYTAQQDGHGAYQKRRWAVAARSFERAAQTFAALDDYAAEATARHNQAGALYQAGEIEPAISAYDKALALNRQLGRTTEQAENLAGHARCLSGERAIKSLEEALPLAVASKSVTAAIQNDLALQLLGRGKSEDRARILDLLTAALKTNEATGNKHGAAVNRLNMGRAHLQVDQAAEAEPLLKAALDQFRTLDDPAGLAYTHEALAKLYATRKDDAQAKFHEQQARAKFGFLGLQQGDRQP